MKKYICIIFILLVCLMCCSVNAEDMKSEFEYYNITYDFLNSNEYYITYKFKPYNGVYSYYFEDDFVYLDTIETNLDDLESPTGYNDNYLKLMFSLNESKEYYIKYKGYIKDKKGEKYLLDIKPILKSSPRYIGDTSSAVSVYSFELRLYHPEKMEITKDKILNDGNLIFEKDDNPFILLGGEKYEKEKYYNVTIAKKLLLKSDEDRIELYKNIILCILPVIIICIYGFIYKNKMIKKV